MRLATLLAIALALPAFATAQQALPGGTVLPVTLDHGINAARARTGQIIRARVEQTIPGTPVKRHSHVLGQVVSAMRLPNGTQRVVIRFTSVEAHGRQIPLQVHLRAIASFMKVADALTPQDQADRSEPPEVNTFRQIGGEMVYRGGGPVAAGDLTVGKPVPYGVLVTPRSNKPCRGVVGATQRPQAFWVFSSDACGVYGIPDLRIEHAGRSSSAITLASDHGKLKLPAGTALLLRTSAP
ncbi:MAG: hypothetical protein ACLGSD_12850 [Acidobacteriota bacterium]